MRTTDSTIHAWDLALATGVDDTLDTSLVAWIDRHLDEIYAGLADARLRGTAPPPAGVTPLRVTAVRLGAAEFGTDRGRRRLPAWLFTIAGVTDPAAVLAVAPRAVFRPPGRTETFGGSTARVGADGRTLTVAYIGGPPDGPCATPAIAVAAETGTAVAVVLTMVTKPAPATPVACAAVGYPNSVTVRLRAPLGARVLVNLEGAPYQVSFDH